jgi:uncharacterized protein YdeI (YjbR/CyaY-like superfamily)
MKRAVNSEVEDYISKSPRWRKEMESLRKLVLDCGLTEELKWGKPCYAFEGGNVVLIQGFKAYCALLFFKGALLKDADGMLVKTGENTRVGRQIRFNDVREIEEKEAAVKACIRQAIEVEKAGLKVEDEEGEEPVIPEELQSKLDEIPALKAAFEGLTPGRQRGYIFYFSAPKQSKTRISRIEKCMPQILSGKGLNDRPTR